MTNEPLYYLEELERLKKNGLSPKESYDKIRKKHGNLGKVPQRN